MRLAISIPLPLFKAVERLSQRLNLSRSELYVAALTTYLKNHQESEVTEALNQVYETEESSMPPVLVEMQVASIEEKTNDTTW